MSQTETVARGPVRCPRCGFMNGQGIKFCGNCGAEILPKPRGKYAEALAVLLVTSSLYMLLTLVFNYWVHGLIPLLALYSVSGIAGLYVGYALHRGEGGRWLKFATALTIGLGLAGTLVLFLLGLGVDIPIDAGWVLYVVSAVLLWTSRKSL